MPRQSSGGEGVYAVRSIERVCQVLRLLGEAPESVTLQTIVRVTGLPKSSAFRYLAVLEAEGFVERDRETGDYRLGVGFIPLQARQVDRLIQRTHPILEQLRDKFDETMNLGMLDRGRIAYLDIVESRRSVRLAARPGDRDHLHCTALGKAIAAELAEAEVREILKAQGMPSYTTATITDMDRFVAELAVVRSQGYALDDRENESEGRCIAVFFPGANAPAAISMSSLASRLDLEKVPAIARALRDGISRLTDRPLRPIDIPAVPLP